MDALASPLDWGTRSATGGLQVLAAPSNAVVGLSGTAAKLGGQRGLSLTGLCILELSDFAPKINIAGLPCTVHFSYTEYLRCSAVSVQLIQLIT